MEFYKTQDPQKDWGLDHEETMTYYMLEKVNSNLHTGKHLNEIKSIFDVQLAKEGAPERPVAVNEIIKYLYGNTAEEFAITSNQTQYSYHSAEAEALLHLANIIDAANKNDKHAFASALNNLPWNDLVFRGESQIAAIVCQFAYWLLGNEGRTSFGNDIANALENYSIYAKPHISRVIDSFEKMAGYNELITHNEAYAKRIEAIKTRKAEHSSPSGSDPPQKQ